MYVSGGCNRCDFSEPDNGYGPIKCAYGWCGKYAPRPVEVSETFAELYVLIEKKSGEKKLFDTIEEFNSYYLN